jgi:hypothetical protein
LMKSDLEVINNDVIGEKEGIKIFDRQQWAQ